MKNGVSLLAGWMTVMERAADLCAERELFVQALDFSTTEQRAEFLAKACAGDPGMRRAVEGLLEHHQADSYLERPLVGELLTRKRIVHRRRDLPRVGEWCGGYRLVRKAGEGGCGVVYQAERSGAGGPPAAVKFLRPGRQSRAAVAALQNEASVLARMSHSNIAAFQESGVMGGDSPFLAMEWVDGCKITHYCEERGVALAERIRLVEQVCGALEHVHSRGFVHGDVKPSNILVRSERGAAKVKLIDFGVAKRIGEPCRTGDLVSPGWLGFSGTPAYASPEQARVPRAVATPQDDIFSLGLTLTELVWESAARLGEFDRKIGRLGKVLLSATFPDRSRRFRSASELGSSLRGWLAGEWEEAGGGGGQPAF